MYLFSFLNSSSLFITLSGEKLQNMIHMEKLYAGNRSPKNGSKKKHTHSILGTYKCRYLIFCFAFNGYFVF